ncbi:DUF7344 domain-containing protein [Halorussus halobius]|uniref:DUF7344 domain-containing protein n=1 Tax=Halorussus halobius TaxID=1710537 RepID=UPI001B2FFE25|nr:hypothetical protein [Halorussus halobius]
MKRRRVLFALLRERPGASGRGSSGAGTGVEVESLGGGGLAMSSVDVYHNHLPKLDDLGFVSWDRETGVVAPGPQFEEIRPLLELLADNGHELVTIDETELTDD